MGEAKRRKDRDREHERKHGRCRALPEAPFSQATVLRRAAGKFGFCALGPVAFPRRVCFDPAKFQTVTQALVARAEAVAARAAWLARESLGGSLGTSGPVIVEDRPGPLMRRPLPERGTGVYIVDDGSLRHNEPELPRPRMGPPRGGAKAFMMLAAMAMTMSAGMGVGFGEDLEPECEAMLGDKFAGDRRRCGCPACKRYRRAHGMR